MTSSGRTFAIGAVAAMALGSAMRGASLAIPAQTTPEFIPAYIAELPRRKRKRMEMKWRRAKANIAGHLANRKERGYSRKSPVIESMTNWQRTQWARAGYPLDDARKKHFAELVR